MELPSDIIIVCPDNAVLELVPPLAIGNTPLTSVVNDTWLELTRPALSLCNTPAVVNLGRYNELKLFPIVTLPVDPFVLIFVALLELSFKLIAPPDILVAPVTVNPLCPVSNPADVIAPVPVVYILPLVVTPSVAVVGVSNPAALLQ